jgi:hypothetical protein
MRKQLILIYYILALGFFITACTGPIGPQGTVGPAGPAGP